jgi:transcriptional regulator with XRE-family HTH domain
MRHIVLREQAGLTQEQEAKKAGVSPTTISGIESGKITRPHFRTILKLAGALGVRPDDLAEREPPKGTAPPSSESTFNDVLEEERRVIVYLRAIDKFVNLVAHGFEIAASENMVDFGFIKAVELIQAGAKQFESEAQLGENPLVADHIDGMGEDELLTRHRVYTTLATLTSSVEAAYTKYGSHTREQAEFEGMRKEQEESTPSINRATQAWLDDDWGASFKESELVKQGSPSEGTE